VSPNISLENITLVLVYATIILSWVGYHKSILRYPYNKSRWSRFRLFFDIVILLLYSYLVFVGQDLPRVLLGLAAIFFVYSIDGLIRIREWRDSKVSKPWLSFLFGVGFVLEWYSLLNWTNLSWVLVFLTLGVVFGYREVRGRMGYPTLLVVGVDVDGVLGEQVPPVLERLRREGKGINLTKESITDWNFPINGTDISREIEKALLDSTFIREMPVVQSSTTSMEQLHKKYHVVIATSRPLETQKSTIDWLKKNFKFHEFVNTREVGKDKLGLDVLIDDNLDNVKGFASSGGYALLFLQPWNLNIENQELEQLIRAKKIVRCEGWEQVLKSLQDIERHH
jgi:5'(3')-deoxyribonucleotidase